jgi:hypothetical protein
VRLGRCGIGAALSAGAAVVLALGGCAAPEAAIAAGDIPAVPGMRSAISQGLERRGDELVAGRFAFHGRIEDAATLMDRTISLFSARGWAVLERQQGDRRVRATLEKGDRRCEVTISPNRIDPAMSTALIVLFELQAAASPPS